MYTYQVKFYWSGCTFLETQLVYDVDTRAEAIKAVKNHYGRDTQIISAVRYKE